MARIEACRKNRSLKDSNPQLMGENRLTVCRISGITYIGTQTPPMAERITTETDPNDKAC